MPTWTAPFFRRDTFGESLSVYLPAIAVSRLIGLARVVVLTHFMTTNQFGLFQVALLVINLFTPLCSLGLNDAVARYVPQFETDHAVASFVRRAVFLLLMVTSAATLIVLITAGAVGTLLFRTLALDAQTNASVYFATHTGMTRLAALCAFALIAYYFMVSVLKGLRMFRALSLLELFNGVLFTVLAIAAVEAGSDSAVAVVNCYLVATCASVLLFAWPLHRALRLLDDQATPIVTDRTAGLLIRFGMWTMLAALIGQCFQFYPLWHLHKFHGPSEAGVFAGARNLTQILSIAAYAVMTVVAARVTKTWHAQGRPQADTQFGLAFKMTLLALLAVGIAMNLMSQMFISLLGEQFQSGARLFPPLLLFFQFSVATAFLSIHFQLIEKARLMIWPNVIGLAANILFVFWWARPGSSDPVFAAAMAGAWAAALALASCLLLVRSERRPIHTGQYVLLIGSLVLLASGPAQILAAMGIAVLITFSHWIMIPEEKSILRQQWHGFFTGGPDHTTGPHSNE
jgi:O-antigen/teichoic acid export membrane protein